MSELIPYLVKSSVGISLVYLLYWLLLSRENYFLLSRFLLVTGLVYTSILPLININVTLPHQASYRVVLDELVVGGGNINEASKSWFSASTLILIIYFSGLCFFLSRLIYGLVRILLLIRRNGVRMISGRKFVLTSEQITPFSFFDMIFMQEEDFKMKDAEKIIEHEETHIRQFHTFDIFLAEIISVLQWFNPVVWVYRKTIKEIHEFLADEKLLKNGTSPLNYQKLLLTQVFGVSINHLTNNFNQTILKRRFLMMKKIKSKKSGGFRILIVLVFTLMAASLTLLSSVVVSGEGNTYSDQATEQMISDADVFTNISPELLSELSENNYFADDTAIYSVVKQKPEYPGGAKALYTYLGKNIKYPEKAQKDGVEGTVYVEFIIEKDGSLSDVGVLRGFDKECDAEAVRVVKSLPDWKPGRGEDNQPLRVIMSLPIKFLLSDGKEEKE